MKLGTPSTGVKHHFSSKVVAEFLGGAILSRGQNMAKHLSETGDASTVSAENVKKLCGLEPPRDSEDAL